MCCQRYGSLFGQEGRYWLDWPDCPVLFDGPLALSAGNALAEVSDDHSGTNTQVAGVDEGDLVETDGEYLYVLSDDELVIIDALPANALQVASRVQIDGQPFAEYLNGDRLTVLLRNDADWPWPGENSALLAGGMLAVAADMAYSMESWQPKVTVTVLDLSDPAAPSVVQETDVDGWYEDSRRSAARSTS